MKGVVGVVVVVVMAEGGGQTRLKIARCNRQRC